MTKRRRRSKSKKMRFYQSVAFRIFLTIIIPPVILFGVSYRLFEKLERVRIIKTGERSLSQLTARSAELLKFEASVFRDKTLCFSADPEVAALLAVRKSSQANARLDELRQEYGLQSLALIDRQGATRAQSGSSSQLFLTRFPKDLDAALDHQRSLRFAMVNQGVVLQTMLPVEKSNVVLGALVVSQKLALNPGFEHALLICDGIIQSESTNAQFLHPFVSRHGLTKPDAQVVLMDGALLLGAVAIPGVSFEDAVLMVGINQGDSVFALRETLKNGLKLAGMVSFVLVLVGIVLSYQLMRPIYRLIDASKHVVDGDEEIDWPVVTRDEFGTLNGALHLMTDRMREAMRRSDDLREDAEAASRAKVDFLANVSHELRTPLNGIIGMTEILMNSAQEKQKEAIRTIRMSSDQLVTVIGDIFDVSRIGNKDLKLKREDFDLKEMLCDFVSLTNMAAKEKGLTVEFKYKAGTPECVRGDRTRIRQIISNLVSNAIKFTETGGIEIHVHSRPAFEG